MTTAQAPKADRSREGHRDVIRRLRRQIDEVLGAVADGIPGKRSSVLDFPDHANVGDSAIYGGEIAWLRRHLGRGPVHVEKTPRQGTGYADVPADSTIYLHGGGNFGDLYPRHQTFREALLRDCPGRPVVHFPQSIHYGDAGAIARTAEAIGAHGALTLLLRDHESRELAERHFDCTVRICPDMAFALGEIARPAPPMRDVLMLMRGDKERVGGVLPTLPEGWRVTDWMDEPDPYRAALNSARRLPLRSFNPLDLRRAPRRIAYFQSLAEQRIDRGITLLGSARYVITDRLHAHILCTLCGIPHAFLDNSYGKIRRFSSAFDTVWSEVTPAHSIDEAIGAAQDWLARA